MSTRQLSRALRRSALLTCVAALLIVSAGSANKATAQTSVAVSFFYDQLEPDGYWVEDRYYGTVWYPSRRGPDWRPYTFGHWVWTAEYGWYWESDEPWGWAVYHYGRWVYTPEHGWVWVAGEEWAPAWVEWRYGGGYVGWAPMPPEAAWRNNALVYADVDLGAPRYRASWVFVSEADFAHGSIRGRFIPANRNATILNATARATNYTTINGRIINRGIDVTRISAATRVRIDAIRVVHSGTLIGARTAGQIRIYQPRVMARSTIKTAPPGRARIEADERVLVRPPEAPSVGGSVGGGVELGRGGLGVGIGGGLRIGR